MNDETKRRLQVFGVIAAAGAHAIWPHEGQKHIHEREPVLECTDRLDANYTQSALSGRAVSLAAELTAPSRGSAQVTVARS